MRIVIFHVGLVANETPDAMQTWKENGERGTRELDGGFREKHDVSKECKS